MTWPTASVKVYFGLEYSGSGFATYDDPVRGVYDDTTYLYANADGDGVEIASDTFGIQVIRGRSRELDEFETGVAEVTLHNFTRTYDNLNTAGIYYGDIVPGKRVEIAVWGQTIFTGTIEDWNLEWSPHGEASATFIAADALGALARQEFDAWTTTATQTSGVRLAAVLDRPEVAFPSGARDIDTGNSVLQADSVTWGSNVLNYCQLVNRSEQGRLFASRHGLLTHRDRYGLVGGNPSVTFTDTPATDTTDACTDVLAEPFNDLTNWAGTLGTIDAGGRTGTGLKIVAPEFTSAPSRTYTVPVANRSNYITLGFALKIDKVDNPDIISLNTDDGVNKQTFLRIISGVINIYRGPNQIGQSTVTLSVNTWYYIEWQAYVADTGGYFSIRVDGTVVCGPGVGFYAGGDTRDVAGTTPIDRVCLYGAWLSNVTSLWDDLYISTGAGCAFKGDHPITSGSLSPSGGVKFHGVTTATGSEFLYNRVGVDREGGTLQTASDSVSQNAYGIRTLTIGGLLVDTDAQSAGLAGHLLGKYKDPTTRISSITVKLHALSGTERSAVTGLEIGDMVAVTWTPRRTGPAIVQNLVVEHLEHGVTPDQHIVTIGTSPLDDVAVGIYDDADFGIYDDELARYGF